MPLVGDVARALAGLGDRDEFIGEEDLVFPNQLGQFTEASENVPRRPKMSVSST